MLWNHYKFPVPSFHTFTYILTQRKEAKLSTANVVLLCKKAAVFSLLLLSVGFQQGQIKRTMTLRAHCKKWVNLTVKEISSQAYFNMLKNNGYVF